MRRPYDEFINQFREKYGDRFLSRQAEREIRGVQTDMGDPMLPDSCVNGDDPIDVAPTDEANTDQTSRRESGYSKHRGFHAPDSFSSMIDVEKYETFHDRNVSGSDAVLYNNVGDILSPLSQWSTDISRILDEPVQPNPQDPQNAPCFTSLAKSQGWPYDDTHFGQANGISTTLVHHNSGYSTLYDVYQDIFTSRCSGQSNPKSELATPTAQVNEHWIYGHREKFRYNATLQAPTAMHQPGNEKPVTYLNKGQPYSLTVADSTPPTNNGGFFEYRTFVYVSLEGEDQRSNPVASWQLWKEGRGLKEANERKGKLLAVEFIEPSQSGLRIQGHCQVQLEEASVNDFCVIWTADPTAKAYEAVILLKFNFVPTDFTRAKGSNDRNKSVMNEPERCYSLVKVLRDHGAERKLWNDKIRISKRAEKLSKRIMDREANANFASRCHNESAINGRKFDVPSHKKRKSSISPRKSPTSEVLRAELATTVEVLSSARLVSVLALRGNMKDRLLDDRHSTGAINLVSEGAAQIPNKANIQVHSHSPVCQERPPKVPYCSVGASKSSPSPAKHSSKSGSYHRKSNSFYAHFYFAVACFYILFALSGKQPEGTYHAIYLTGRTSRNLKVELAAKLHIDPCLIPHIIWINSKGLKVVVDDDVVGQLPEGQIMIASVHEHSTTEMAPSSAKRSEVEVELVFQ
ncbi:transcriptional regulator family: Grainyhead/CP2 [Penicillium roqueforti]|nr:transcriptional regulator family: Grainyhead/CP2 [Penicillium roqueforti]KAI2736357.1 transcriptional regulator family: Grainyhead/CP2 [Penicillium roqueforti]KAI2767519.1 transcriptional regulator family: Grainyhead/CP2 [Penicillium roqueforti]KAI3063860.1 transcriptional regulator family: Grainyhead/CP2 [Penicillium roqueforti]KAI3089730.1 transcriptional regulator family: Grainyhead/CP2 [Penicillium roqueforti]